MGIFKILIKGMEGFEVAILDGFFPSLVQPQTKKHWHLYRKSASHEGGMEEAQLEEIFEAILVLTQASLRLHSSPKSNFSSPSN